MDAQTELTTTDVQIISIMRIWRNEMKKEEKKFMAIYLGTVSAMSIVAVFFLMVDVMVFTWWAFSVIVAYLTIITMNIPEKKED